MNKKYRNPRADHAANDHRSSDGAVKLDSTKTAWLALIGTSGTIGSALTFSWSAFSLFVLFTGFVLLFGHSLGMHRMFIHKSYSVPRWLYVFFVHLGTLVGIAGPLGMLRTHDIRDWAQRQQKCHAYFAHLMPWWKDMYWQLLCSIELRHHIEIEVERDILNDKSIQFMEKYWMLQQLPWALLFYYLGGWGFVFWGISSRVLVSNLGHWLIGYLAHNEGERSWHVDGAAVQGHNVKWTSLLTMGECWHNNHHAFPYSAKFGLQSGQWDPGWWCIKIMEELGLAKNIVVADLSKERPELVEL